jgi:hypothetical protein
MTIGVVQEGKGRWAKWRFGSSTAHHPSPSMATRGPIERFAETMAGHRRIAYAMDCVALVERATQSIACSILGTRSQTMTARLDRGAFQRTGFGKFECRRLDVRLPVIFAFESRFGKILKEIRVA